MKHLLLSSLITLLSILSAAAQTQVIAHRGYWTCEGSAQNSIASIKASAKMKAFGSEFDVLMTKDGTLVVNHDNTINGVDIQKVNYEKIKDMQLPNGETISTLEEYLTEGKKHKKLKLIFELKPHYTIDAENRAVQKSLAIIKEMGLESQTEYISFSINICERFSEQTDSAVSYLGGDLTPEQLKSRGIDGLDYHHSIILANPTWVESAKTIGISTNAWTINDMGIAKSLIEYGIDYITTDYPEEVTTLIKRMK